MVGARVIVQMCLASDQKILVRWTMSFKMNHIHLKTPDPQKTAQFYVDNLGAKIVGEAGGSGLRLDLHGLGMNITSFIESQTREQVYGIEHIAIDTDDMDSVVTSLKDGEPACWKKQPLEPAAECVFRRARTVWQLEVLEMPK